MRPAHRPQPDRAVAAACRSCRSISCWCGTTTFPASSRKVVCDLGIVGENVLQEQKRAAKRPMQTDTVLPLGYARCKLVLAVPEQTVFRGSRRSGRSQDRHLLSRQPRRLAGGGQGGGRDRRHDRFGRGGAAPSYRGRDLRPRPDRRHARGQRAEAVIRTGKPSAADRAQDRMRAPRRRHRAAHATAARRAQAGESKYSCWHAAPLASAGHRQDPAGARRRRPCCPSKAAPTRWRSNAVSRESVFWRSPGAAEGRRRQRHPGVADREDDG